MYHFELSRQHRQHRQPQAVAVRQRHELHLEQRAGRVRSGDRSIRNVPLRVALTALVVCTATAVSISGARRGASEEVRGSPLTTLAFAVIVAGGRMWSNGTADTALKPLKTSSVVFGFCRAICQGLELSGTTVVSWTIAVCRPLNLLQRTPHVPAQGYYDRSGNEYRQSGGLGLTVELCDVLDRGKREGEEQRTATDLHRAFRVLPLLRGLDPLVRQHLDRVLEVDREADRARRRVGGV